jgi:hypothetical protein
MKTEIEITATVDIEEVIREAARNDNAADALTRAIKRHKNLQTYLIQEFGENRCREALDAKAAEEREDEQVLARRAS